MSDVKSESIQANSLPPQYSDGSELVPAEVQANNRHAKPNEASSTEATAVPGTTVDDEGLINNFAVEPEAYSSEYPSPRQQRRYIYWGIAAVLLVVSLVFISFFSSQS